MHERTLVSDRPNQSRATRRQAAWSSARSLFDASGFTQCGVAQADNRHANNGNKNLTGFTYGPVKVSVENRWNSSGKLVVRVKIPVTCYLFGAAPKNAERVGLWIRPCPSNLSERFWAGPFSTSDRSFVRALQHAFRAIIRD